MPALIAVAIFPVLIALLVALTKAENMLGNLVQDPTPAPAPTLAPAPLALVEDVGPQLRLVEDDENLAA